MKPIPAVVAVFCFACISFGQQNNSIFSYKYTIDDLPNGLRLITIPTDFRNMVSLNMVVQAGSRNEAEPGKTGYAHLFEHLMTVRGGDSDSSGSGTEILKRAGADANAYTSLDKTVFYENFTKDDIDEIMKMEADRFQRLKYSEAAFKTESLAVLGEYNKNSSDPVSKLFQVIRATAFRKHPYNHSSMGFIEDIQDMPNQYGYSMQFFQRYYRPEYVTITITGDVTRDHMLELTRKYFGDWKHGAYVAEIPTEPVQTEPRSASIDWPSPTLPWIAIAYRGPAYSDVSKDKAALDLLSEIAFGQNSDLFQRLVIKEQKVDMFWYEFPDQVDSDLLTVTARVKNPKDIEYVRSQIQDAFRYFATQMISQEKLDATRSRRRYEFALHLDSNSAVADNMALYIGLRRTPETIDQLFRLYEQLTPDDIRSAAAKYFSDDNRTTVTLTYKGAQQ